LECAEKKSPLFRRGSWSPNLRLLRRDSNSNFLGDSQSLVRIVTPSTNNCAIPAFVIRLRELVPPR